MLIRPIEELQRDLETIKEEIENEFKHGAPTDMDKYLTDIVDRIYHL